MVKFFRNGVEMTEEQFDLAAKKKARLLKKAGLVSCDPRRGAPPMLDVMAAHDERYANWYGEPPPPVIEDYRCEEAKKTWPHYKRVWTPQGWKEGPARFRSFAEQSEFERTYGFHQETGKKSDGGR